MAVVTSRAAGRRITGTSSDGQDIGPKPGRWTHLTGDGAAFLYVPQIQSIFSLPDDVGSLFAELQSSDVLSHHELLSDYISHLVSVTPQQPLSTKRSQRVGLKMLVIHVSQICNLDCVYCYARELNEANKIMSLETAAGIVERTSSLSVNGVENIKFLGGEPTLAWHVIEYLVGAFEREASKHGWRPPSFVMVSNGTKMTDAMAKFIGQRKFKVLISIDGGRDIHDALRPQKGGRGSFAQAVQAVRTLLAAGVDTAIESVYTREHFRRGITPSDLARSFSQFGVTEFQITPAVGTWHHEELIQDIERVGALFETLVRDSVRSFRTQEPFLFRGIQFVLDGFALRERRTHVCGAGRDFMAVNYDGEAFPCYLLESADTSYGFVSDERWSEERHAAISRKFKCNGKNFHPVCRGCWANEICQSCLGTTFQIEPEIAKPPAWFCAFQKRLIAAALGEFAAARASPDWSRFLVNMRRSLAPLVVDAA